MIVTAFITLGAFSIVLFLLSFFTTNTFKRLENEMEQIQLQSMQEMYNLKKKVRVLEEELLHTAAPEPSSTPSVTERIHQLYDEGYSIRNISEATHVNEQDVYAIVRRKNDKGAYL